MKNGEIEIGDIVMDIGGGYTNTGEFHGVGIVRRFVPEFGYDIFYPDDESVEYREDRDVRLVSKWKDAKNSLVKKSY